MAATMIYQMLENGLGALIDSGIEISSAPPKLLRDTDEHFSAYYARD